MSEIGLNINVDSYNNEGIKTIKGNNNAEIYKLYILKNKRRLSLIGKTVKLGYVMAGTTKGDIIENLNITNAEQGEITFPITNRISKKDGVYSCQLAIYGADEFLEYTATFGLTVEANIFNKIAYEIADNKDLTYIERILEEAINTSEELKSNIPVARQLNIDLENQNRILNENMDRANGANNTLITTTEQSKVAATDAIEKKSQLESSIVKAKEFIDGLDGSQNIPQIRLDVTELQNGLKSNQALEYSGSSISAENTLEGRTEGMRIGGRTLVNLWDIKTTNGFYMSDLNNGYFIENNKNFSCEPNTKYTIIYNEKTPTGCFASVLYKDINGVHISEGVNCYNGKIATFTTPSNCYYLYTRGFRNNTPHTINGNGFNFIIIKGELKEIINCFESLKSFGEAEQEGDKYKIKLLSKNKNFFNKETNLSNWWGSHGELHKGDSSGKKYSILTKAFSGLKYIINVDTPYSFYTFLDDKFNVLGYGEGKNTQAAPVGTTRLLWYLDPGGIDKGLYNKIQVEPGTKSTEYQSYQEDKKDILISAPLRSVYDVQDIMYEDNGQVKITRNIDTYTFTGDETMRDTTEQDEKSGTGKYKVFVLTINKTIDKNKNINNNFPKKQFSVAFQKVDSEGLAITQYGVYIKILKSKLSTQDAEGLKAWLKANQTVIYFSRATPVTETVENCVDIDLDTYQEKTYFNILNSLPGTLDFKVPSNIGSLVQSNAKEINNINEFINNFILEALLEMNKDLAAIKIKNGLN
ncbi:MAG: BppU family phage baseplate upper protein [Clostridium perfringens]|nr:BppU family phage baseplate upper protein [Clostridium perfringens]